MANMTDPQMDMELVESLRGKLDLDPAQIAACAYAVWESCGRPEGQDQAHWYQAETHLLFTEAQDRGLLPDGHQKTGATARKAGKPTNNLKPSRKKGTRRADA